MKNSYFSNQKQMEKAKETIHSHKAGNERMQGGHDQNGNKFRGNNSYEGKKRKANLNIIHKLKNILYFSQDKIYKSVYPRDKETLKDYLKKLFLSFINFFSPFRTIFGQVMTFIVLPVTILVFASVFYNFQKSAELSYKVESLSMEQQLSNLVESYYQSIIQSTTEVSTIANSINTDDMSEYSLTLLLLSELAEHLSKYDGAYIVLEPSVKLDPMTEQQMNNLNKITNNQLFFDNVKESTGRFMPYVSALKNNSVKSNNSVNNEGVIQINNTYNQPFILSSFIDFKNNSSYIKLKNSTDLWTKALIIAPRNTIINQKEEIEFSMPILDKSKNFIGVIGFHQSPEYLSNSAVKAVKGHNSNLSTEHFLMDATGKLIFTSFPKDSKIKPEPDNANNLSTIGISELSNAIRFPEQHKPVVQIGVMNFIHSMLDLFQIEDDANHFFLSKPVYPQSDILVLVANNPQTLNDSIKHSAKLISIAYLIVSLMGILFGITYTKYIANIMKNAADTINKIIKDVPVNFSTLPITSKTEFGSLARAIYRINESYDEIYQNCLNLVRGDLNLNINLLTENRISNVLSSIRNMRISYQGAVNQNNNLLNRILDSGEIGICIKDSTGYYQIINRLWEEIHSQRQDYVQGMTDHDLFSADIADEWQEITREIMNSKTPLRRSFPALSKLTQREIEYSFNPLFDQYGDFDGVCIVTRDITSIINAKLEVEKVSITDQALFEAYADPVFMVGANGQIIRHNSSLSELLDNRRQNFVGSYLSDLGIFSEKLAYQIENEAKQIMKKRGNIEYELSVRMGTRIRQMSMIGRGFRADSNEFTAALFILRDNSHSRNAELNLVSKINELSSSRRASLNIMIDLDKERKRAEDLRSKAEEATATKANFLAAMSHEIRTPMNGVIGLIDLLRETTISEDQAQMLQTVRDSAFSLLQIINDILDFSKLEAGKMLLEKVEVSVRDVVEGVSDTLAPSARSRSLQYISWIDPILPRFVESDQVRLRQILFNIVGNAIKFTESKPNRVGKIQLTATCIKLANPIKNYTHELRFVVQDNGVGMTDETINKLFQPFTQAETSTTRRFGGTGLGLTISLNLINLMNGTIKVDSQLGHGSIFTISIPVKEIESSLPMDEPSLEGTHIALMVSNQATRRIIHTYLEAKLANIEWIEIANNPMRQINRFYSQNKHFDVIITDSESKLANGQDYLQLFREYFERKPNKPRYIELVPNTVKQRSQLANDIIQVETMPMRRSTFLTNVGIAAGLLSPDITMPKIAEKRKLVVPTIEEAERENILILVAEDNTTNQEVIRRQLNALGLACEIANHGGEAIAMLEKRKFALLITDCHMPEMDGYELTMRIRKMEQLSGDHLPIIALTANALQGEGDHCLKVGMDAYLPKPAELEKIRRALRQWMPVGTFETIARINSKIDFEPINIAVSKPAKRNKASSKEKFDIEDDIAKGLDLDKPLHDNLPLDSANMAQNSDYENWKKAINETKLKELLVNKDAELKVLESNFGAVLSVLYDFLANFEQNLQADDIFASNNYLYCERIISRYRSELSSLASPKLEKLILKFFDFPQSSDGLSRRNGELLRALFSEISKEVNLLVNTLKEISKWQNKQKSNPMIMEDVPEENTSAKNEILVNPVKGTVDNSLSSSLQAGLTTIEGKNLMLSVEPSLALSPSQLENDFGGDKELIRDLLIGFKSSADGIIKDLQNNCLAKDWQAASKNGHKLKSAARAVGAKLMGDLCFEIENNGKITEVDTEFIIKCVDMLQQEYIMVTKAIDQY